ncbi:MAG: 3-dehydroquinate synthase [Chitinophagales bacterium]|nr:MAG: 3-dehydroquinate synthase [Chitinophagales bacterium]
MPSIHQSFSVQFNYSVHFTERVFNPRNEVLVRTLQASGCTEHSKVIFFIDDGVVRHHRDIPEQIAAYMRKYHEAFQATCSPIILPGGETCKNDPLLLEMILSAINHHGIDRHSYVIAVGGGALLDLVGYAAAIAHRGIRHIRIPTTVLSQNDSGIGVKNGINAFGKKNFLGTFAPPAGVINDCQFLTTLDNRDWRAGIAEAIKVALIKDAAFFRFIQTSTLALVARDLQVMQQLIYRCAALHLQHIANGDPFETGSSRPLDFGHWASHKLEWLTNYSIRHGEAVAIGICLDATYSYLAGLLSRSDLDDIIHLIAQLGFQLYLPELTSYLNNPDHPRSILSGLKEFREHLGGRLTVMLLNAIGQGVEVHEMDPPRIKEAISLLRTFQAEMYKYR